ncbi:hypothetical protein AB0302_04590 [Micrococcus sp. NPDC078436]|uniref:hypothetical protein n=1 Tax=Micrococcus sp. NPDC078436 TaxID=3154960 RepID=UPI003450F935
MSAQPIYVVEVEAFFVSPRPALAAVPTPAPVPAVVAPWWAPEAGSAAAYLQALARFVVAGLLWLLVVCAAPLAELAVVWALGGAL